MQRFYCFYKWGGETLSRRSPHGGGFSPTLLSVLSGRGAAEIGWSRVREWLHNYGPRLDECMALVRYNHKNIDYLPEQSIHPSYPREAALERKQMQRRQLGLAGDPMRHFEEQALELVQFFPEAKVHADAIQLDIGGKHGHRAAPDARTALELRLPTIQWREGSHSQPPQARCETRQVG